jgi:hypothetical protein
MFGWLKRKAGDVPASDQPSANVPSGKKGEPIIAAVLMEGDTFPFAQFQQVLAKSGPGGRRPAELNMAKDGILMCKLGDEMCALALMPAPYPWKDLEGPCATSWMWPKETPAVSVIKRHSSHLLVTLIGGQAAPIQRRLCLCAVTALAARQQGVLGVYWPEATLVHYPKVFVEMAQKIASPQAPPLYLWVDFRVFRNPDGTFGLFTTGLKALGYMEFEIPRLAMQPGELREWAVNIACYLIEKGPVLKHGQTIGATADQQLRIRHTTSLYGHPGTVMRFGD